MVGDGERRDAERCVKLVTPFGGSRGFISGPSRSHPHPGTRRSSVPQIPHIHTHRGLAAELTRETLRYRAEPEKANRLPRYVWKSIRPRRVWIFLPDVRTSRAAARFAWNAETSRNERLLAKQWGFESCVLFNSRQREQDLGESCQITH